MNWDGTKNIRIVDEIIVCIIYLKYIILKIFSLVVRILLLNIFRILDSV
jgi:hypothetical protein